MSEKGLTREFLAERDVRIFKMRQAGVPTAEIARRFGVTNGTVQSSIRRQLNKLSQEALLAYPEVLQMELERLDALQSAIWPLTQHRKVKMDDGTEVSMEPDMKAVATVLSIIDRRSRLLGMEQTNLNVSMDVRDTTQNVRAVLAGAPGVKTVEKFDAESEAKKLLAVMQQAGVLPEDLVKNLVGDMPALSDGEDIEDAELVEKNDEPSDNQNN